MAVAEEDVLLSSMALVAFGQCGGIGRSWIFLHVFVVGDAVIEESPTRAGRAQASIANGHHPAGSDNLVCSSGQKIGCHGWIRASETPSQAYELQSEDRV